MRFSPHNKTLGVIIATTFALMSLIAPAGAQDDPLPSWNATPLKQAIVDFVKASTTKGGSGFVPPADRIAVFDMDGTLVPEKPVPIALVPVMADIRTQSPESHFLAKSRQLQHF